MSYDNDHNISELNGRTIIEVIGCEKGSDEINIKCSDGTSWRMLHNQDCCESVSVEDVCGDVADLIGLVVEARQECGDVHPEGFVPHEYMYSYTWTFYIIQTNKGAVTIRWLGESNGYYSESVYFERAGE